MYHGRLLSRGIQTEKDVFHNPVPIICPWSIIQAKKSLTDILILEWAL